MKTKEIKLFTPHNEIFFFINERGESLALSKIIAKNHLVKSVKFECINHEGNIYPIVIAEDTGIIIDYIPGNVSLSLIFNNKTTYDKVIDFNEKTLLKRELKYITKYKYIFSIHVDNLRSVNWIEK